MAPALMGASAAVSVFAVMFWEVSILLLLPLLLGICAVIGLALLWSERRTEKTWQKELRIWMQRRQREGG